MKVNFMPYKFNYNVLAGPVILTLAGMHY